PRYLNTLIRQTSQQTVMDWINQSIILEAKVLLKHSNLLVYQISDELNFPNPSFFCKFFKRMTGMTPQEYQKSE
ncbi:helix-turn-helix domain-containing protein, partial [Bacteroides caccae]